MDFKLKVSGNVLIIQLRWCEKLKKTVNVANKKYLQLVSKETEIFKIKNPSSFIKHFGVST